MKKTVGGFVNMNNRKVVFSVFFFFLDHTASRVVSKTRSYVKYWMIFIQPSAFPAEEPE